MMGFVGRTARTVSSITVGSVVSRSLPPLVWVCTSGQSTTKSSIHVVSVASSSLRRSDWSFTSSQPTRVSMMPAISVESSSPIQAHWGVTSGQCMRVSHAPCSLVVSVEGYLSIVGCSEDTPRNTKKINRHVIRKHKCSNPYPILSPDNENSFEF